MDQAIRNKLRGVVTQCRKLLEDSTAQALQGRFGIFPSKDEGRRTNNIVVEDDDRMAHLTEEDRACRQDLLDHLEHIQAIGYKPSEALEQLVREIAFTHLNRLCAYKMMESRGLIREAVSRGLKSQGFFFYLADHPKDEKLHNGGGQETAYRNFLDWLGGTFSQEIGVLFNPNDPANRIYPPQWVLDEVLALINDGELKDIWSQDETIGWVYQYFTPKELRDKARKESQAPRNSYELAFRNQFFTPRYVVEFLTDNTLGRIWYEMRKGETILKDHCQYLVRRPKEIFLAEGEEPPADSKETRDDLSQEELIKLPVYIPHRPKKDPREIKILDPACGSGHFLLYCFDLLQIIYEEAYDDPDLAAALRKDYPALVDLREATPSLILKYNIHGIDIDLRATQIAALALWLRCQRAYEELGLKKSERPTITRANIVCAEPMPGEADMRQEFVQSLDNKLGQLLDRIFTRMKMAGEAGSLLKIEEEMGAAIREIYGQYGEMFRKSDEQRWMEAENDLLKALQEYTKRAENGRGFRRRLFAKDAAQGFAFVDVCRKKYDVVLMNPPFGEPAEKSVSYLKTYYPDSRLDIYACFVDRGKDLLDDGFLGAITSRTGFFITSLANWRRQLLENYTFEVFLDLGGGVLDAALVSTACYVISSRKKRIRTWVIPCLDLDADERMNLYGSIETLYQHKTRLILADFSEFMPIPGSPFCYWLQPHAIRLFAKSEGFKACGRDVRQGIATGDNFRFLRLYWEVPSSNLGREWRWVNYAKGGDYSPFYRDVELVIDWMNDGEVVKALAAELYGSESRTIKSQDCYFRAGLTFTIYTVKGFNIRPLPADCIFDVAGSSVFLDRFNEDQMFYILGFLSSPIFQYFISALSDDRKWQVGLIHVVPWVKPDAHTLSTVSTHARQAFLKAREMRILDETDHAFLGFRGFSSTIAETNASIEKSLAEANTGLAGEWLTITKLISDLYSLDAQKLFRKAVFGNLTNDKTDIASNSFDAGMLWLGRNELVERTLSWIVGSSFGRFDLRTAVESHLKPILPGPFDPLPICPLGMLQGSDGLPAKPEDVPPDYPVHIDWDGILVDDPEHEDDIVRRVRDVLEVMWKDRAEAIEREACEILGARELRDYFRKPGNGGFWMDHVKRYSKSRRKAPIYWYLRSAKGNYGLWLYYHRLDKDILFKALLNYVEPKIRLEEDRLKSLRGRKEAAGSSGREAKQIEKDMDHQDQLVSELQDFADKLRRAANLNLDPDLNDGVILNMAPLWELVPWTEPKKYWEELQEGKYDWSHIAYRLWPKRVREACKHDRSIAIAHGLEDLYEVEPVKAKRKAIQEEADNSEVPADES